MKLIDTEELIEKIENCEIKYSLENIKDFIAECKVFDAPKPDVFIARDFDRDQYHFRVDMVKDLDRRLIIEAFIAELDRMEEQKSQRALNWFDDKISEYKNGFKDK